MVFVNNRKDIILINSKILHIFEKENVSKKSLTNYNEFLDRFIAVSSEKTFLVLEDILTEYENLTQNNKQPLLIPYGIIYALSKEIPEVIVKLSRDLRLLKKEKEHKKYLKDIEKEKFLKYLKNKNKAL